MCVLRFFLCVYTHVCLFLFVCVCAIHVSFNFGLNSSINSFPLLEVAYSRWFDILALF